MALYNHQPAIQAEKKRNWQLFFVLNIKNRARERGRGRRFWPQLINRTLFRLACTHYLFTGAFSQSEGNMFQHLGEGEGGKGGWWRGEREEVGWTLARCRLLPWCSIRRLHCGSAGSSVTECQWEGVHAMEKPKVALKHCAQTSLPLYYSLPPTPPYGNVYDVTCLWDAWLTGRVFLMHSRLAFSVKCVTGKSMLSVTHWRELVSNRPW